MQSNNLSRRTLVTMAAAGAGSYIGSAPATAEPTLMRNANLLRSWRDGEAKSGILDFLHATTDPASSQFVPEQQRIAVFDNDGTLWTEQPIVPEIAFALARLHELAPRHPEWATTEPYSVALSGDMRVISQLGVPDLLKIVVATQAGTTLEEFRKFVETWLKTAQHPRFHKPYEKLAYQPMLDILRVFSDNRFKCFIVSAGGCEFMRAWTETVYHLPLEQIIGSTLVLEYVQQNGHANLLQTQKVATFTDGPQKAGAIASTIGQRPIIAFGNSDGDYEMLQYVTSGNGRCLGVLIHHDDAEREYAYDRTGHVGKLDRALNDAKRNGWQLVSMKNDWTKVHDI